MPYEYMPWKEVPTPNDVVGGIVKKTSSAFADFCKIELGLKKPTAVEEEHIAKRTWAAVSQRECLVMYPRTKSAGAAYGDATVNPGWVNFFNLKDLLARFFIGIHHRHGKIDNWREYCIGITSHKESGLHVPMLDYDGQDIKTRVKKDVRLLQKKFGLGEGTIYETRGGLHVYFFSDEVTFRTYVEILAAARVCKGFKTLTLRNEHAVLRISAKYTRFDIALYKVIPSPGNTSGRPGRKAALVKELIRIGQECETHLASVYPQWAYYREDEIPWKAPPKPKKGKRIRKLSSAQALVDVKLKSLMASENIDPESEVAGPAPKYEMKMGHVHDSIAPPSYQYTNKIMWTDEGPAQVSNATGKVSFGYKGTAATEGISINKVTSSMDHYIYPPAAVRTQDEIDLMKKRMKELKDLKGFMMNDEANKWDE